MPRKSRVGELRAAFHALESSVADYQAGRLCMHERCEGTVTRVLSDRVVVKFEMAQGPTEQVYLNSQFVAGRPPKVGERLVVKLFACSLPPRRRRVTDFLSPAEAEELRKDSDARPRGPFVI